MAKKPCSSTSFENATIAEDPSQEVINDCDEFIKRFQDMYNCELFSDIVLKVGTSRYHAHKFMLISASEVFQAMLSEDRWHEANQPEVTLTEDEECIPVFKDFLRYMYCGSVCLTTNSVLPILLLADKYSITKLCNSCVEYMLRHVMESPDINRALSWYQYAKITGYTQLQEECSRFILSNFLIIQASPDWLTLSKMEMREFLESNDIVIESEFSLWKELSKWFVNQSEIEDSLKELIPFVRFSFMTPKQLFDIESSDLYKKFHQLFSDKFLQAYRRHSLLSEDVNKGSTMMVEQYRNYSSPDYGISCQLTLANYTLKAKIDSKIVVSDFHVPIQFNPSKNKSKEMKANFHVEFFPKGYYQPHMLYQSYLGKHNENTTLVVRHLNQVLSPEVITAEITMVIYGKKNKVPYVAHSVTTRHVFSHQTSKLEIQDVIPIEKLKDNNSPYLVNGRFEAMLFLKVLNVEDATNTTKS